MKTFKFLTDTALIVVSIAAIVLAIITLVATAACLSVMLGSLALAVHLLADKETAGENTVIETATVNKSSANKNAAIAEVASLRKFSVLLFRIFVSIIRETASRLPSFVRGWKGVGAEILSSYQDGWLGLTESAEMYKKTSAAIVHSWINK